MGKKRNFLYAAIFVVLLVLVYLQFRTWRDFDWATFWTQTGHVDKLRVLYAIVLIHLAYVLRALRWKIFLRPVKRVSFFALIPPTIVGFTGLALLGRPGEMIRPYLIARKQELSFSSQLAVWAVERIFDVGAFTLILIFALFVANRPKELAHYGDFRQGGLILVGLVAAMAASAWIVSWKGESVAAWVEVRFSHLAAGLGSAFRFSGIYRTII